jgi:hypothetical protein
MYVLADLGQSLDSLLRSIHLLISVSPMVFGPSQNFGVTQHQYLIECIKNFMLHKHGCLTMTSPLDFRSMLAGPNRIIQIRDEWKSESAPWQSFCQATAHGVEDRDLLGTVAAEGQDALGSPGGRQ